MRLSSDLLAIAQAIGNEPGLRHISKLIERIKTFSIIQWELEVARKTVAELLILDRRPEDTSQAETDRNSLMAQALFNSAILTYTRCTHSEVRQERLRFNPEKRYDASLRSAHREICAFRDKVLAHFGSQWREDSVRWFDIQLLLETDVNSQGETEASIACTSQFRAYRGEFCGKLEALTKAAYAAAVEDREAAQAEFYESLRKLPRSELGRWWSLLKTLRIEASDMYKSIGAQEPSLEPQWRSVRGRSQL